MNTTEKRIEAIILFGEAVSSKINNYKSGIEDGLKEIIIRARNENPWFTEKNILMALENWITALKREHIKKWTLPYLSRLEKKREEKNIAVVNAGNIPFVGLHDLLTVLLCGHRYSGKNATGDSVLLPYLSSILISAEESFNDQIRFVDRIENIDAVIATGNNNSARYFEYYFGKYPHIIRKNRNGAGVLTGNESNDELHKLGKDIFSYFGLGCRNVSKLYVPSGYDLTKFFEAIEDFKDLMNHSKYMNNFDYNNSVFLLKRISFLQNGFLIIREEKQIASPVSVLHYEEYDDLSSLADNLGQNIELLQCLVSAKEIFKGNKELEKIRVDFGETQLPALWDYADGVDTVEFLCKL